MSILKKPLYPQKVEVVNQNGTSDNPQQTQVTNLPMTDGNTSVRVTLANTSFNLRPSSNNSYTVQLDNILLLQGDGTFVPIPLNTVVTSVTNAQINTMLANYKTAYATLVSGVTAATLHYSKLSNTSVVTSEVFNLKD